MTTTIKYKENSLAKTLSESHCRQCRGLTNHEIVSDLMEIGSETTHQWSYNWDVSYQIIQCKGCNTVSFRSISTNSEDYFHEYVGPNGEFDMTLNETVEIYPNGYSTREPIRNYHIIPSNVQTIYLETIKSFGDSQPVLCGIGIRAIIETICKHEQTNGPLHQRIDQLVEKGFLTQQDANSLHKLRIMGNEAAHEVKPHKEKSLELALDIVDHLLKGCYILPHLTKDSF